MGDEKRILHTNVEWKRSCGKRNKPPLTTPKADLYPKKMMYMVGLEGSLYYERILENQII